MKRLLYINNTPRYVRCYDNGGETLDRYTVVFTKKRVDGQFMYIGMNSQPFQGIGQHGFSDNLIDRPTYSHLGREISFSDLPEQCKQLVMQDYKEIWEMLQLVGTELGYTAEELIDGYENGW